MCAMRKSSSPVVKISPSSHLKLQELAKHEQRPMGEIVNDLVDRYEEEQFWMRVRGQLERLKADPVAWQEYIEEIALLEGGSMDGLEDEDPYYTPEELEEILGNASQSTGR